ncbi:MAG: hypothetical protein QOG84_246 [Sphingomonadales bacterium]|nr:hypothetical protein [Sphingomonadales bacterium]
MRQDSQKLTSPASPAVVSLIGSIMTESPSQSVMHWTWQRTAACRRCEICCRLHAPKATHARMIPAKPSRRSVKFTRPPIIAPAIRFSGSAM